MRTALALLVLSAQGRADAVKYLAHHAPQYLEPNVQRYAGVIPKSVCDQLIDLGENGASLILYVVSDRSFLCNSLK